MKNILKYCLLVALFSYSQIWAAPDPPFSSSDSTITDSLANDSIMVMDFYSFMRIVKEHHPVGRQAELQRRQGLAVLRQSRGGFDPKLMLSNNQKVFDDKNYYELLDGGLKIPTWFGLEINGGYENTNGVFLNREDNTPGAGLVYAGVGLPIGQGLFIDERRAELRQAQIFQESTEAMRLSIYNELLNDASRAYWDWFLAYHVRNIYQNALEVARQRFDFVKQSYDLGDSPAIDTLESGIQVQNRLLTYQQSQLDYQNASALLEVFLWRDGNIPLELDSTIIPEKLENASEVFNPNFESTLIDSLIMSHPDLMKFQFKIDQLDIERRWKQEQLKPVLDLKYNFLAEPVTNNPISEFNTNNYKWGLEFEIPILLRKERGGLLLTQTKVQETKFDYSLKLAELNLKWRQSLNEVNTTNDQINLYSGTVRDYEGLLNGERNLFRGGESSLFLVNRREIGFINAQVKLAELISKNRKARIKSAYSLGVLPDLDF